MHIANKFQMSTQVEVRILSLRRLGGLETMVSTRGVLSAIMEWKVTWLCPHEEPQTVMGTISENPLGPFQGNNRDLHRVSGTLQGGAWKHQINEIIP